MEFPIPTTRRALCRFLGMAGYYRSFCRNFSSVAHSLTKLLSPSTNVVWTSECQHAFDTIKALLTYSPVLAAPDLSKPFKLEVDASFMGAGAVLLQEYNNGIDYPVSHFSCKFNKNLVNYSTNEKETCALLVSLQQFEVYLGCSIWPIVVYTDPNPFCSYPTCRTTTNDSCSGLCCFKIFNWTFDTNRNRKCHGRCIVQV